MSNRYLAHLQILPEDDANREIVNGFLKENRLIQRRIQVLPVAGGWGKTITRIEACQLERFSERRLLLLSNSRSFEKLRAINRHYQKQS